MRIEKAMPSFYINTPPPVSQGRSPAPDETGKTGTLYAPGVIVEISPEAKAAYANKEQAESSGTREIGGIEAPEECQTCKNRKYVDKSDDSSVSYQTPTRISPGQAAGAVLSHEQEHVSNEQAKASREDRKVVSQTVTLSMGVCPECGKMYVAGGVTRTVTVNDNSGELANNMNINVKGEDNEKL